MTTAFTNPTIEADACIICGHIVREDLEHITACSHCTGTICQDCIQAGRTHCTEDRPDRRADYDPEDYPTNYETITPAAAPYENNSGPMRTPQEPPR